MLKVMSVLFFVMFCRRFSEKKKKTDFVDEREVGTQAGSEPAQRLDSGWA